MAIDLLPGILSLTGAPMLRLIRASLRIEILNRDVARAYTVTGRSIGIGAFWHRHLIPIASFFCRLNAVVMVSRSRDGELISRAVERTPLSSVRGSSSRGGRKALDELINAVNSGRPGAITCDGPRGPARKVKIGIVVAACRTGAPIIPIVCAARPAFELRNWDNTLVPYPGARALFAFGDPIHVRPDATTGACEEIRGALERQLCSMEQHCEARLRNNGSA